MAENKSDLTYDFLFNMYQNKLAWINRRLEPETLKFYEEDANSWKHTKGIIFDIFEELRYFVDGGVPKLSECMNYKDETLKDISSIKYGDYECKPIGILTYRNVKYPVYHDDYGMQDFIVVDGHEIPIRSFAGAYDWYYELDSIIDKIN